MTEPDERFCGQCGAALLTTATATAGPSPPPEGEPEGERKQLTVLFADIKGSMDLQESLDPEAWAGIMGRFVQVLAEGVRRFGGTVDKFTGDGVMALFGAPRAQEDHARRACQAAWHLSGVIASYAEELRRSEGIDLQVRLGLNSGEVVVGRVGDELRLDPTALGHTVGLAQRMEALAVPGRAYLTEHTARLVEGWYNLTDLGPTMVKGAREPLRVLVLEGPAPPPSTDGARSVGSSPLVGRERELAALEDALAFALEGRAQVVGVVGEAGVGKSRLCEEFARSLGARGIRVRRTTGVSYGRDLPLLPILSLLRDHFAVVETDTPAQARQKVAGYVLALDPDLGGALPVLFDFLGVPDPERPAPRLAPEVRLRRIFETLRRMKVRRSERREREVLVLLVEDLHWFDPQSETFLERLIESFPGSRTLVVTNFRPEFSAPWMRHSYYRQLPLDPLRSEAVGELLGGLLGVDMALAPLLSFMVERTGGNPFFVEEVVRSLVEDGTLVGEAGGHHLTRPLDQARVPPGVQAVLAARIDRLSPGHKTVLETAAVIGRTFPEAVLARVAGLTGEALEEALLSLCAAELLQEVDHSPVLEFRFWHPLTQEVAYASMLAPRRARLHAAVAEALVDLDPARQEERAALIAFHYQRAGEHLEAARWEDRAATGALRRDLAEAVRRWGAALTHLAQVPDSQESLRLGVRAETQLLRIGRRAGLGSEDTLGFYREGKAMAERLEDPHPLLMLEFCEGVNQFTGGNFIGGLAICSALADRAAAVGDVSMEAVACHVPCYILSYVGPLYEGMRFSDRVMTVTKGNPSVGAHDLGHSPLLRSLVFRAQLLALTGRLAEAMAEGKGVVDRARERSETETVNWALAFLARFSDLTGEVDEAAQARAAEAVHMAEETGNLFSRALALQALGLTQLAAGRGDEAISTLTQALSEVRDRRGAPIEEAMLLVQIARAFLARGDGDAAMTAAEEAVSLAREQEARVVECFALLVRAQVRRLRDGAETDRLLLARVDLDAAAALAVETGAVTYDAFIGEERARLDADAAALAAVARRYEAIGAVGHARRLEMELAATWPTEAHPLA